MRVPAPPWRDLLLGGIPGAVPLLVLGGLWGREPILDGAVVVGALAIGFLTRWAGYSPVWGGASLLGALALITPGIPFSLVTAALAGAAGLGLLLGLGEPELGPGTGRLAGLLVPGLTVAIALGVGLLLPVGGQAIGVAAALLALAIGGLGWTAVRMLEGPASEPVPPAL